MASYARILFHWTSDPHSERTLSDERARAQAQFVDQVQAFSRLEARALALQERLDRVEAERLRVRIRERRVKR